MRLVWDMVNKFNLKKTVKSKVYLAILITANMLAGAALWCLIGRFFLPDPVWLFCFMGYPAVLLGLFGGLLYLCNHEFA